jgi:hypothetical protein
VSWPAHPDAASSARQFSRPPSSPRRPRRYRYHYVVEPGTSDWTLETWLYDPRRRPKGSDDFQGGGDPVDGHGSFGLCQVGSRYGRYTIKARLRWYDDPVLPLQHSTQHTVWLKPARFHLHR